MEWEYIGNKKAADLKVGDFVTLTGYKSNVAEIEEIYPVGNHQVAIRTNDGAGKHVLSNGLMRVYQ